MEQDINNFLKPEKNKNKNVFYTGLLSFFGGISQDIFSPILPIYFTSVLGFDKAFVGIAEGVVTASSNISKIVAGFFSDKFKKQKPIIFIGYFLSMISRPLLALVSSAPAVFALRFFDGVGKGIKDPPKSVLIAGSSLKETRGKSFGIERMLDTLGSVVGPLILFGLIYFLGDISNLYHAIIIFAAIPLVITLILIVLKVREMPKGGELETGNTRLAEASAKREKLEEKIGDKSSLAVGKLPARFYLFIAIIIIFTLGNSSDAFLILRARNLGVTLIEIPIVIALFNLVYAVGAVYFGSLSDKIGRIPTLLIGWFSFILVYFGFASISASWMVWALYAAYGIYYATSEGVARAFLADIVGPENRGKAFGIYGTAVGLTAVPASFFAGFLWDKFSPQTPFYFGAAMASIASILLIGFYKLNKKLN